MTDTPGEPTGELTDLVARYMALKLSIAVERPKGRMTYNPNFKKNTRRRVGEWEEELEEVREELRAVLEGDQ